MTLPNETNLPEEPSSEPAVEPAPALPEQESLTTPQAPARPKRGALIGVILAAVLLLALAGGFFALRGQESSRFAQAQTSAAAGDWAAAESALLSARAVQPNFVRQHDDQVTALLAESYYRQGKYEQAQAELDRALAAHPADPALLTLQVNTYLDQGKLPEAVQAAQTLKAGDASLALPYAVEAWQALRNQKYGDALSAAGAALERDAQQPLALRVRGSVRAFRGEWTDAQADLDAALKTQPEDIEALAVRVYVNDYINHDDLAKQDVEQLTALAPNQPVTLWAQAIAADKQYDQKTARELLDQAVSADATRPEFYYQRAATFLLFSEEAARRADIETALKLNPEFAPALFSQTLEKFNDYEKVDIDAAAQQLEKLAPKSGMSQQIRARMLGRQNKDAEALKLIDEAISLNPRVTYNYYLKADLYQNTHQFDQALAELQKILDIFPNSYSARQGQSSLSYSKKDNDQALKFAEDSLKIEADDPNGYLTLAMPYLGKEDTASARAQVEKALKLDPTNPQALSISSMIASAEGNYQRGVEDAALAIKAKPGQPYGYLSRSMAYASQQNYPLARQDAVKATEIDPNISTGWLLLARLDAMEQDWEKAVTNAQKVVELNPYDPQAYGILGQSLAVQGKIDEAIPNLKKVIELDDTLYQYQLLLAIAQRTNGDNAGAKATLATLMEHKDKLDINILQKAEEELTTLASIDKVASSGVTYQDPQGRFSLRYSSDWKPMENIQDVGDESLALVLTRQQGDEMAGFLMVYTKEADSSDISPEDLAHVVEEAFGSNTGYKFGELQTFTLGELKGLTQTYEQAISLSSGQSGVLSGRLFYVTSGNRYIWFEFKASSGDFNRLGVEVDAILESFKTGK